jgi:hypothetical protein
MNGFWFSVLIEGRSLVLEGRSVLNLTAISELFSATKTCSDFKDPVLPALISMGTTLPLGATRALMLMPGREYLAQNVLNIP